jgi:hypothetical protein
MHSIKHIEKANEADAIDHLLIVDSLFRSHDLNERKRYVKIVDSVKNNNGQIKIFSSLHVSGERKLDLNFSNLNEVHRLQWCIRKIQDKIFLLFFTIPCCDIVNKPI